MIVIALIAALSALGWVIAGALSSELDAFERFGLAYGIGSGVLTLGVFLGTLLGAAVTLWSVGAIYVLLFAAGVWTVRRRAGVLVPAVRAPRFSWLQILIAASILMILAVSFAAAAYWPPYMWDSLAVWALKGKVIAETGTLAALPKTGWPFYPLNVSLQIAFLYLLGGEFLQSIFPMYLLSLAALLIANLRRRVGWTLALACALFLVATPIVQFEATIAYADLPFAFYYVGSAVYLCRYLSERKRAWLVVSSLLIGLAAWTRTEGPMYLAINLVVLFVFSRPFKDAAKPATLYAAVFAALWLPWTIWTRVADYGDYFGFAPLGVIDALTGRLDLARLGAILSYFGQRGVAMQDWGLLWIGLILALVLAVRRWRTHAALITLVALNALAVVYTYYVATAQSSFDVDWWLVTGFDRITLHWIPLAAFLLGEAIGATKTVVSR